MFDTGLIDSHRVRYSYWKLYSRKFDGSYVANEFNKKNNFLITFKSALGYDNSFQASVE